MKTNEDQTSKVYGKIFRSLTDDADAAHAADVSGAPTRDLFFAERIFSVSVFRWFQSGFCILRLLKTSFLR